MSDIHAQNSSCAKTTELTGNADVFTEKREQPTVKEFLFMLTKVSISLVA